MQSKADTQKSSQSECRWSQRHSKIFIFITAFSLLHLLIFLVARLFFFFYFKHDEHMEFEEIFNAMRIGMHFDMRLNCLLLLPAVLSLIVLPWRWIVKPKFIKFYTLYLTILISCIAGVYIIDLGHYAYLKSRISYSIISFVFDGKTSLGMVLSTYHVFPISLAVLFFSCCYYFIAKNIISNSFHFSMKRLLKPTANFGFFIASFLTLGLGIHGSFNQYPLRWSDAYFSKDEFISAVTLNPILFLYDTMEFKQRAFPAEQVSASRQWIQNYYQTNNDQKTQPLIQKGKTAPNIVVIVMESFATAKSSLMNNPLDPTPGIKEIAAKSLYYPHYFVPVEGTARSLFALLSAVPDVSPYRTSSRNPMVVKRKLPISQVKDYKKFYFFNGSTSWANMRALFTGNLGQVEIVEGTDFSYPRVDVWGISDADLFDLAFKQLAAQEQPYIAIVQTSAFHRPYTLPADLQNFKPTEGSPDQLKNAGFISNEELNSLRFSDHALLEFIKRVEKDKKFDNTVFFITGDHGLPDEDAGYLPAHYKKLGLAHFHVPLVVYNSKNLVPIGVNNDFASEIDLFPSIVKWLNPDAQLSNGMNIFQKSTEENSRYIFYYFHYRKEHYGIFNGKYFFSRNAGKEMVYDFNTGAEVEDAAINSQMGQITQDFYIWAHDSLWHPGQ